MGFDQYHEPPEELSAEARTFARMIVSLLEEAEAIRWYDQRIAVETDDQAKAIMENAQQEEFKHFAMDLEFLLRARRSGRRRWRRCSSPRATSSSSARRPRRPPTRRPRTERIAGRAHG